MSWFFGFDSILPEGVNWFFNINHLFLIIFVIFFILALYFILNAKTKKGIKNTKIALAITLFVFEVGRMIYNALLYRHQVGSLEGFDWFWNISFMMCAIMVWVTIVALIMSCFMKEDNKTLVIFKNILFGTALVGGLVSFIYPELMRAQRSFFHFMNMQTVIVHILLIFIPIYLIKVKELEIRFKNLWMPALGFLGGASIAMSASQISGLDFAFSLSAPFLENVGINLPFPWHLPVVFIVIFFITVLLYILFEFVYRLRNESSSKGEVKTIKTKSDWIYILIPFISALICALLLMFIPVWMGVSTSIDASQEERAINSWLGVIILLPFIGQILIIVFLPCVRAKIGTPKNIIN